VHVEESVNFLKVNQHLCLLGKRVGIFYHDHDPARVEVFWEDRFYGFIRSLNERLDFRVCRANHHIVEV